MKRLWVLVGIGWLFVVACSQQSVVTQSFDKHDTVGENISLGFAKDLPNELIQQHVLAYVDTVKQPGGFIHPKNSYLNQEIKDLYRYNNYNIIWSSLTTPNSDAKDLLNGISECADQGLHPEHYLTDSLLAQLDDTYLYNQEIEVLKLIKLDINLSKAYIAYAHDLYYGHIDADQLGGNWQLKKKYTELAPYLAGKSFKEGIKMITPKSKSYKALQKKLQSYMALNNEGGWNTIPDTMRVAPGETHEAIYLLRDRLFYTGDYGKGLSLTSKGSLFDRDLQEALIRFQKRHGLQTNGTLNQETIAALNVPIENRIDQIKINLERMKWIPETETEKNIQVNIPDFRLTLYKRSKEIKSFKAIVGKNSSKTPILTDQIEFITFNPSWFVSDVSFNRHILPKVKEDPSYLKKFGYKLYARKDTKGEQPIDANSVQWAGINVINTKFRALHAPNSEDRMNGKIKFTMPNKEGLFICDAANPALFDFSYRSFNFSSVSVENPELLAKYLLDDRDWTIMNIREHMKASKPESVSLKDKVVVNVVYLTSWVDADGVLQFRDDIYGYDKLHADLLHLEDLRWNQQ